MDWVSSSPRCVQCAPPSVVPQTPSPMDELWRLLPSPLPTYTTFLSEGAIATEPMDSLSISSNIDFQLMPPSVVLHRPPVAKPMYMVMGSCSEPTISSTRPIITAGPMERNSNPCKSGSLLRLIGGAAGWAPRLPWAMSTPEKPRQATAKTDAFSLPWEQHFTRIDVSSQTPVTLVTQFCGSRSMYHIRPRVDRKSVV